jgi:tetratricopeptide (TPR) repeat protein
MHWAREEPKNLAAQILWARALVQNRRLPEAEAVARMAVALAPNSPEARLAMGDVLFQGEVYGKAGLEYTAALKSRPDWLPALIGLGNVAVEKKLLRLGLQTFEKATRLAPENPDAWVGLGRAHYNQKFRFDKALEAFERARRLAPARTDYFPYLSDTLRANYRLEEAEAVLRQRVAAAPTDARGHYLLALTLLDDRRTPEREVEAERLLRTSLQLEPRATASQARLGQLLLEKGKAAEAVSYLEEALGGDPYNARALSLLARAYRQSGDREKARIAQQQSAVLARYTQRVQALEDEEHSNPLDIEVHRKLATLFLEGGEVEKARKQQEMVYMLENHRRDAERGLKALNAATTLSVGSDQVPPHAPRNGAQSR